MRKAILVIVVVAIVSMASFTVITEMTTQTDNSRSPFLTLTANITDPSPQANFQYGYASPNLWGFQSGQGTTTMSFYPNSSLHTLVKLFNISKGINIFAYPSIHLTYGLPMALKDVYKDNLSSYVRFDVKNISSGVQNDIAYDMFLGQNGTYENEVEILIVNTIGGYSTDGTISIPLTINGTMEPFNWTLYIGASGMNDIPRYLFVPNTVITNRASVEIGFSQFLMFLQNNSYISIFESVMRMGIGSEFVSIFQPDSYFSGSFYYSFWLYSYFIVNGKDYQIVQSK